MNTFQYIKNRDEHEALVSNLDACYPRLKEQGFESIIFDVDDHVLKIPKYVLYDGQPFERVFHIQSEKLLRLTKYAPELQSKLVPIDCFGYMDSKNPAVITGILQKKGVPWFSNNKDGGQGKEQSEYIRTLSKRLAIIHTDLCLQAQDVLLEKGNFDSIEQSLVISLKSAEENFPLCGEFVRSFTLLIPVISKLASELSLGVSMGHGDPNLQNVVLYNNRLQWIDPGRGPRTLISPEINFSDEGGWDLAIFYWSCRNHIGEEAAYGAAEEYFQVRGIGFEVNFVKLVAWEVVFLIALIAVTARYGEFLLDLEKDKLQSGINKRILSLVDDINTNLQKIGF